MGGGGGGGESVIFLNMNPNLNNKTKINFAGGEGLVGVVWVGVGGSSDFFYNESKFKIKKLYFFVGRGV